MPTKLRQRSLAYLLFHPGRRRGLLLNHPRQTSTLFFSQVDLESRWSGRFTVRDVARKSKFAGDQLILSEGETESIRSDQSPGGSRIRDGISVDDTLRKRVESFVSECSDVESDSELGTVVDLSNLNVDWRRSRLQSLNSSDQRKAELRSRLDELVQKQQPRYRSRREGIPYPPYVTIRSPAA